LTYLHVVRTGVVPPEGKEDKRPWIVHVVKREATIGPHTFHLHEIYGLSSQSTQASHPPTDATHTYPPIAPPPTDDEPTSECLVCLSSPREVVLLPCRHLVACRECAVNMVEFGAGGAITHAETEPAPAGDNENTAQNTETPAPQEEGSGVVPQTQLAQAQAANRRKRRAKGWFCPVCRQPYTSLLRITTTLPPKEEAGTKAEDAGEVNPQVDNNNSTNSGNAMSRLTAMVSRPLFTRGVSRNRTEPPTPSELERGDSTSH